MKIGLSIYSLWRAIQQGMSLEDAIQWMKDNGADHFEVVSFVVHPEEAGVIERIRQKAEEIQLPVSAFCTGFDVLQNDPTLCSAAVQNIKRNIDYAHQLGAPVIRSDLSEWGRAPAQNVIENFQQNLPKLIKICRALADYAAAYGMTLCVENHGTYINGGDRVRQLLLGVDHPNFRCTLDVGNAICVDEDPIRCMNALLPFAAAIHFKDFYLRDDDRFLDNSFWNQTNGGRFFRGAIVGQGELPVEKLAAQLKASGYDGNVCIEFEGAEDPLLGSKISMDNVRKLLCS